jgi:hypothetical protein
VDLDLLEVESGQLLPQTAADIVVDTVVGRPGQKALPEIAHHRAVGREHGVEIRFLDQDATAGPHRRPEPADHVEALRQVVQDRPRTDQIVARSPALGHTQLLEPEAHLWVEHPRHQGQALVLLRDGMGQNIGGHGPSALKAWLAVANSPSFPYPPLGSRAESVAAWVIAGRRRAVGRVGHLGCSGFLTGVALVDAAEASEPASPEPAPMARDAGLPERGRTEPLWEIGLVGGGGIGLPYAIYRGDFLQVGERGIVRGLFPDLRRFEWRPLTMATTTVCRFAAWRRRSRQMRR